MFQDYYEARDWLETFIPQVYGKEELGLARIKYLLKLLGNPEKKFKSIHIAGTSGKGSTAFYTARLLSEYSENSESRNNRMIRKSDISENLKHRHSESSEYKVGLHVSPHLVDIRERMQIFSSIVIPAQAGIYTNREMDPRFCGDDKVQGGNNTLMPMGKFLRLFNYIKPVVEGIQKDQAELTPSYFEILVAAVFKYFAEEKVDWAIVEVGLGGRLDATNVLTPEVSVITNVGLDHTDILGSTVEKIAYEKVGIVKQGVPVVTGATGEALGVIRKVAREKKASLIEISNFKFRISNFKYCTAETASLAVKTVETLGFKVTKQQIEKAFSVGFAGRFEEVQHGVVLDGAHNPDKIRALISWLTDFRPRTTAVDSRPSTVVLVLAFKQGKNWKKMVDLLVRNLPVEKVIATEFQAVTDTGRFVAVPSAEIAAYIMSIVDSRSTIVKTIKNSQEAVFEALDSSVIARRVATKQSGKEIATSNRDSTRNDSVLMIVTGSLYLVGEVRTMWVAGF